MVAMRCGLLLFAVSSAGHVGCGGAPAGSTSAGSTSEGSTSDTGETEELSEAQLVVPMVPVDSFALTPVFDAPELSEDPASATLRGSLSVDLALGDEYPAAVEAALPTAWIIGCGSSLEGGFEITDVTVDRAGLTGSSNAGGLSLVVSEEGDFVVAVRGLLGAEALGSCAESLGGASLVRVELDLAVTVRRPEGVELDLPLSCRDEAIALVEPGAALSGLAVHVVDLAGEALYPANADRERPATIEVFAAAETSLELSDETLGIGGLVATGVGSLRIRSNVGDVGVLELVDPGMIDEVELVYWLMGAGGGGLEVRSGEIYGAKGWARTSNSISPEIKAIRAGGARLCSSPRLDAFILSGATPETCVVVDGPGDGDSTSGGTAIAKSARVLASGLCELSVLAPEYAGGLGIEVPLATTILNAESLTSF